MLSTWSGRWRRWRGAPDHRELADVIDERAQHHLHRKLAPVAMPGEKLEGSAYRARPRLGYVRDTVLLVSRAPGHVCAVFGMLQELPNTDVSVR
jgi:hypothetical protein